MSAQMNQTSVTPFPAPPENNLRVPAQAQPVPTIVSDAATLTALTTPPTVTTLPQPQPQFTGSPNKEVLPPPIRPVTETAPIVELQENEPIPAEVEGWLQKLDSAGEIKLPEPITHDGDVLLAGSEAQVIKEKLVLPVTQSGMQQGLKSKVDTSARWLAEWCNRLIKIMKGEVKYAKEETT